MAMIYAVVMIIQAVRGLPGKDERESAEGGAMPILGRPSRPAGGQRGANPLKNGLPGSPGVIAVRPGSYAPPPPRIPGGAARVLTRRRLEMALGVLWLADGVLQWQPYIFSSAFFANMLGMANMGLPGPVPAVLYRTTSMLTAHPLIWNAAFASLWPRRHSTTHTTMTTAG
jgi:hypothetical protein